ncbi:DHA2 family efflux MFS transporter permease subunit [Paenibacillus sp. 5J-6]|uniref:DHA2 family efflux MFS transporter permease subunit n=1 Tax=Paenibacillus silvestris TaxID=2606219 RepID=A0A6L8UYF8_9BACL|nr:MDR family MFS transporter [Paenibacillus silvestris]MZQ83007.1 DHA2 family efflux MFS transporter permease subunit [Paenibacillus silvestris]
MTEVTNKTMSIKSVIVPLLAIIIGMFMVILDSTAMTVAIPKLREDFGGASLSLIQWTVTGYALAQAAVIPLAGWLSDRFGSKQIYLTSILLFTIGSALCAFSTTTEQLIVYRIIQGLGGGMVAPIAIAFTYRLSPPGKQGAVMGMIGIPMLLAPALGPVLSGWLVDYATWHWIFIINIPVGVGAIILGLRTLPALARQSVPQLDVLGMIFAPLAFAGLVYGVSEGGTDWGSAKTWIGLIIGGAALVIFVLVELNRKQPLLELRVFKSADFSKGIIVQGVSQIALFGTLFLFPLFLQTAKGYSALDTGLILLPQALATAVLMPIGGKLFDKIGARPLVIIGLAILSTGAFLLSTISSDATVGSYILPLILIGAGMGLSYMPLNTHVIQSAPPELVSRVTSLTNAAQQVMTSFAVAGAATILARRSEHYLIAAKITNPAEITPAIASHMAASSYGYTFLVLTIISVVGTLIGFLLSKPKLASGEHAEKAEMPMMTGH